MNDTHTFSVPEYISALADGELPLELAAATVDALAGDSHAQATWHTYHVIGDVLRSPELAPGVKEQAFWERLQARLPAVDKLEPVVEAPVVVPLQPPSVAANASQMHWRWAGLAAGIAVVGLVAVQWWGAANPAPQLAVQMPTDAGVMIRDPQLDALLAAHQQMGGHSALQGPSGFLRNATYERPQR
jgi:sigma-E factor negative regulatory protein RseA